MNYEVKKINWLTSAVFSGLFYGILGLVPMVFGLIAFLNRALTGGFNLRVFNFLLFPAGFFIGGFVAGAIFAAVYNLVAKHWSGVKLEIDYNQEIKNE